MRAKKQIHSRVWLAATTRQHPAGRRSRLRLALAQARHDFGGEVTSTCATTLRIHLCFTQTLPSRLGCSDAVEDSAEEGQALVAALIESNGLELLFQVGSPWVGRVDGHRLGRVGGGVAGPVGW